MIDLGLTNLVEWYVAGAYISIQTPGREEPSLDYEGGILLL